MTNINSDKAYLQRCCDLARLGAGTTAPNPMVGAVIVHQGVIIGEGYHQQYGKAHAEVNAVQSVAPHKLSLLAEATLYVSLEPCCIVGNTPPCTDLVIRHRFRRVVVARIDATPAVAGKGLSLLQQASITTNLVPTIPDAAQVACLREHWVHQQRPYVTLKWAQTADGYMGKTHDAVWLSNAYTTRLTHKLRSETHAILVGTNTARTDNPALTTRHYGQRSPLRFVLDRALTLPPTLSLFTDGLPTIVITAQTAADTANITYWQLPFDEHLLPQLLKKMYAHRIATLLVEGGAATLHTFIRQQLWEEAWVYQTPMRLYEGIKAPILPLSPKISYPLADNVIEFYRHESSSP